MRQAVEEIIQIILALEEHPLIPREDIVRHIEETLEEYQERLCDACERVDLDSYEPEPRYNEGYL